MCRNASLPSSIFIYAVVYGFYGCLIGTIYTFGTKWIKTAVHDWFQAPPDEEQHETSILEVDELDVPIGGGESMPLVAKHGVKKAEIQQRNILGCLRNYFHFVIPYEPTRAAVAGTIAGALCGVIGIFLPHTLFWGEAQLQNLIDKGRTSLPIFGDFSELTVYALCMINPDDPLAVRAGFGIECSALIAVAKTVTIGLSLGTGIIGGHFWGPLFAGCASALFFSDAVALFANRFGFGFGLTAHPCVVILCTMGAAHVGTCGVLDPETVSLLVSISLVSFTVYRFHQQ